MWAGAVGRSLRRLHCVLASLPGTPPRGRNVVRSWLRVTRRAGQACVWQLINAQEEWAAGVGWGSFQCVSSSLAWRGAPTVAPETPVNLSLRGASLGALLGADGEIGALPRTAGHWESSCAAHRPSVFRPFAVAAPLAGTGQHLLHTAFPHYACHLGLLGKMSSSVSF